MAVDNPAYVSNEENLQWKPSGSGHLTFEKPSSRHRGILCVLGLCMVVIAGMVVAVVVMQVQMQQSLGDDAQSGASVSVNRKPESPPQQPSDPGICLTKDCVTAAANIIQNIDPSVHPCDDFYKFACGGWMSKRVIPNDRSSMTVFGELDDTVTLKLKDGFNVGWMNPLAKLSNFGQKRNVGKMLSRRSEAGCDFQQQACMTDIDQGVREFLNEMRHEIPFDTSPEKIEEFCGHTAEAAECLNATGACDDGFNANEVLSAFQYICSDEGREVLGRMNGDKCDWSNFQQPGEQCQENHCSYMQCEVASVQEACGDDVREFVQGFFDAQYQC